MNNEQIADKINERINQVASLPAALAEVERLRLIRVGIGHQIQDTERFIENQRLLLEELIQRYDKGTNDLFSATQDVDDLFSALYHPVAAPAETVKAVAKLARTKKTNPPPQGEPSKEVINETAAPEAETESGETGEAQTVPGGAAEQIKFPCSHCDDVFYKEQFLIEHLQTAHKGAISPVADEIEIPEPELQVGNEHDGIPTTSFDPLDEALGDCELCQGYGVIEGELYGEFTLVPCTCPAGIAVRNKAEKPSSVTLAKCCEDCSIENPECADCHLPDMEVPFVVEEPAKPCSHPMTDRTKHADGSVTCNPCGHVLKESAAAICQNTKCGNYDKVVRDHCGVNLHSRVFKSVPECPGNQPAAVEVIIPKNSSLQAKCPHPKPFRELTEHGTRCKVCSVIIDQPALFEAA